jgi:hypothetical protein
MAQTTRIDHSAAKAGVNEAREHVHTAIRINNSILDTNTEMTSAAWTGVAATKHRQAHEEVHGRVHGICNLVLQHCDTADSHLNANTALDEA